MLSSICSKDLSVQEDRRLSRIQFSDKTSCLCQRHVATKRQLWRHDPNSELGAVLKITAYDAGSSRSPSGTSCSGVLQLIRFSGHTYPRAARRCRFPTCSRHATFGDHLAPNSGTTMLSPSRFNHSFIFSAAALVGPLCLGRPITLSGLEICRLPA